MLLPYDLISIQWIETILWCIWNKSVLSSRILNGLCSIDSDISAWIFLFFVHGSHFTRYFSNLSSCHSTLWGLQQSHTGLKNITRLCYNDIANFLQKSKFGLTPPPFWSWSDASDVLTSNPKVFHQRNGETCIGLVPAQDAPFALILWYVEKIIYFL